jgi:hypothetical protein
MPQKTEWNSKKFPYSTPVEADVEGDTVDGTAFFDGDPEYPCQVLVLSVEYGLILKWSQADNHFIRIGVVDWYCEESK